MDAKIKEELAHDLIDLVENMIRKNHPLIEAYAEKLELDGNKPKSLFYGSQWEDAIIRVSERIEGAELRQDLKISKEHPAIDEKFKALIKRAHKLPQGARDIYPFTVGVMQSRMDESDLEIIEREIREQEAELAPEIEDDERKNKDVSEDLKTE